MRGLLLIPALVAATLVYAALDEGAGIRPWLQLRREVAAARIRVDELRRENRDLEREIRGLGDDPFAIEAAIRRDLGLARRGEVVIRFSSVEPSNPRFP